MKNNTFTLINGRIIDPENLDESLSSLVIEDGFISSIDASSKGKEIDCRGLYIAPGIVDMGVKICEPGERHKESFKTAGEAALSGGITTIVTRSDTYPSIDNPETLDFLQRRSKESSKVKILPLAALTKKLKGKKLTEMKFLLDRGAIGFSDCFTSIKSNKIFLKALSYASELDALVIGHPQDYSLSTGTSATSGSFATIKGLSSVPALAEKIGLERDLSIVKFIKARYHADQITTKEALDFVNSARSNGDKFTVGTSIHHINFNEYDIANYRTFFKLSPPLRKEIDREAIINGLIDKSIDTISSFHTPQDEESKRLPFEKAASGAVGLETLLPSVLNLVQNKFITLPELFRLISFNPSKILRQPTGTIKIGCPADLIVFEKDKPFILNRFKLLSKSKNTPFDEAKMQGKVIMTFVNGKLLFNNKYV